MKKRTKGLLIAIAVLVAAAAALCIWQWNNIQAAYLFLTKDSQTISEDLDTAREEHRKLLEEQEGVSVRPPDTDQSNAILDGSMTAEAVKDQLGISEQMEKLGTEKTREELVSSCVAELYACKVDLMEVLAAMKQEAVDKYLSLPEEKRTQAAKREIGLAGLNDCYELEVTVDAEVQEILGRYRASLGEIGGDTGIIDELWEYYESEKAAEKAYYMDKYLS